MNGHPSSHIAHERLGPPRWDDPAPVAELSQEELAEVLAPHRTREHIRAFAGVVALALVACALALAISAVAIGLWVGVLA